MPLNTCCRRCGRLFPVYAQQLKERRGKVQCPQCGGRFDGVDGLVDEAIPGEETAAGRQVTGGSRGTAPPEPAPMLTFDEPDRTKNRLATTIWLLGIGLLTAGLILQAGWWERDFWLSQTHLHKKAQEICERIGCRLPLPRRTGAMEILNPALTEHPEHPEDPGMLHLTLELRNRTPLTQRLPLIQLELYDEQGGLSAARRFSPDQYLVEPPALGGLEPGSTVSVTLDIGTSEAVPTGFRVHLF